MWGTPLALRNVACLAAGPSGWPIDSVRRSIPDRPQGCWWHSCLARGGEVCGDESEERRRFTLGRPFLSCPRRPELGRAGGSSSHPVPDV